MIKIRENPAGWLQVDIRLRSPSGEWIRERRKSPVTGFDATRRWAQQRERELMLESIAPKPPPKKKEVPTLKAFWPRFLAEHVKANNQKPSGQESKNYGYRTFLQPRWDDTPLDEIGADKVAKLKAEMLAEDYAPGTVNNVLALFSKILNFAIEIGVLETRPLWKKLKTQTPPTRTYEHEEYERLVVAAQKLSLDHYVLVLLAGEGGLRKGELAALRQDHCNVRLGVFTVEIAQWKEHIDDTKGMAFRRIPMTQRLREALRAHRHKRGPNVFAHPDGRPMTANTLRRKMQQAQKKAAFEKPTGAMHILRHSFVSHATAANVPVTVAQRLVGHKSIQTTMRYVHPLADDTHRAIQTLERERGKMLAVDPETATFAGN